MCIDDWTSECWAVGFSEVSEKLLNTNSNEIIEMIRNNSIDTVIKDLKHHNLFYPLLMMMMMTSNTNSRVFQNPYLKKPTGFGSGF
ncbi:CLUMA_CG016694, isoform A [Clunio marinus]|uniref:CLUMA_CG016694, isoform A n=1 Tax=Clunio marinus TaxID=568069 RepID=A0A1J1IT88_9DIPT|nr:CLUMA_CG016694, isoform A [Clunio marinus]